MFLEHIVSLKQLCLLKTRSHDCSEDHGWLRIGVTAVRGAGLVLFWKSSCVAHLSRQKQRCDVWAQPNSGIYSHTV